VKPIKPVKLAKLSTGPSGTEDICALCEDGGLLVVCDGLCRRAFHYQCLGLPRLPGSDVWYCPDCDLGIHTCLFCGVPGGDVSANAATWASNQVKKCCMGKCGRFYHRK
jgi:hypothetical protein